MCVGVNVAGKTGCQNRVSMNQFYRPVPKPKTKSTFVFLFPNQKRFVRLRFAFETKNDSYDYDLDLKAKTISTIHFWFQKRKPFLRFCFGTENEKYFHDFVSVSNRASRNLFSSSHPKNCFLQTGFTNTFTKGQVRDSRNGLVWGSRPVLTSVGEIS